MLIGIVGLYILGQIEISIKWEADLAFWMYSSFAGHCLRVRAAHSRQCALGVAHVGLMAVGGVEKKMC